MNKKLYVVGSVNVDLTIETPRMVEKGETIKGSNYQELPGGKGANQAVAASRLGIETYIVGNVGMDLNGELAKTNFNKHGVNTTYLNQDEQHPTGVAIIIKTEKDNRIILDLGANVTLTAAMVEMALKHLTPKDVVLTQLENPIDTVVHTLRYAKQKGAFTVFNPAPVQSLPDDIYRQVDIIVVNETEAALLTDKVVKGEKNYQEIGKEFLKRGVQAVILTLGEKGSVYMAKNQYVFMPSYSIDVVDTTGAGDSFIGGFLSQLMEDKEVLESLEFANAVAAFMCQIDGAQSDKLSNLAVNQFMKEGKKYVKN